MSELNIGVKLSPELDVAQLNVLLRELKTALGPLGKDVKLLDAAKIKDEMSKVAAETKKASDETKKLQDDIKKLGDAGSGLSKAFQFNQITQAVQALSSTVTGLADPFVQLDKVTQQLKTLGPDAKKMADGLRDASIQMSKDLPFSAAQIQQAMFDALASGVKGGEEGLKSFADTAAKLAVGGGAEIGQAVQLLAGQMNAYGDSSEAAARYSDVFFNTVNYGVTSVGELSSYLSQVVPNAAAAGVEIENVGAALAVMTSKGIPTAQSTTKLNALLVELQKPGSALAPILKKAGVSLESLRRDDLPVTLGKVQKAIEDMGTTATLAFSSVEATSAFNTLAGNADKLSDFGNTFADVRDTAGSTQFAYDQMADSISVQTDMMLKQVEAFAVQGLGFLGDGFVTASTGAAKLAPMLTTIAQLKNLVPEGLGDKVKDFAVSILTKLVPSIGAQAAATGTATTAQVGLNVAMLANPIGIVLASVAALTVATKLLTDAFHDSAEEKAADAASNTELLETQKKQKEAQLDALSKVNERVATMQRLGAQTEKTAAQEKTYATVVSQLAAQYPEAIKQGQSMEERQAAIAEASKAAANEIIGVGAEIAALNGKISEAKQIQLNLEADVSKEQLENELADVFDQGIGGGLLAGIEAAAQGDFQGALKGFAQTALIGPLDALGLGDEISEFITGTSPARKAGEAFLKDFSDNVYGAKNVEEITKAQTEFAAKVALDGEKMGMSKEEQLKAIKGFNDFAEKRKTALEQMKKNDEQLTKDNAAVIAKSFEEAVASGMKVEDVASKMGSAFQLSGERVKEAALAEKLSEAKTETELAGLNVEELAKKYGLPKEKVVQMVEEQKKMKNAVDETAAAVEDLGAKFNETAKAQREAVTKQGADLKELIRQRKTASGEEKKRLDKEIAAGTKRLLDLDAEADATEAISTQVDNLTKTKEKKAKKEKSAFDTLSAELTKQQKALEVEKKRADNAARAQQLAEKREKNVSDEIKAQERSLKLAEDELAKAKALFQTESGEFVPTLKGEDLEKARLLFEQLNLAIEDEKLKLGEVTLKFDPNAERLKLREQLLKELRAGVKAETTDAQLLIDELKKDLDEAQTALASLPADAVDARLKLLDRIASRQSEISDVILDGGQKRLDALEEQYEKEKELDEKRAEEADANVEAFLTSFARMTELGASAYKDEAVKELEKMRENGLLGEEAFNKKKEELEKEAGARLLAIQKANEGQKLAIQIASERERLNKHQAYLEEALKIAQDTGNTKEAAALTEQLDKVKKDLETKGDDMAYVLDVASKGISESLSTLLAGDPEAAKESMKSFLGLIVGYLEKLLSAAIIEIVLGSSPLKALAGTFGFAAPVALAGFTALIGAGIRAITSPILSGIASFATGGVFTKPTLALVGDGSRLGGNDVEFLLRDNQLRAVLDEADARKSNSVVAAIGALAAEVSELQFRMYVKGSDLTSAVRRTNVTSSRRTRGLSLQTA